MPDTREESSKHAQLVSLPLVDQKPNKTQKYLAFSLSPFFMLFKYVKLSISSEGTAALEKSVANLAILLLNLATFHTPLVT